MVLKELYDTGKKMSVNQVIRNTGLTLREVHNALTDLKNRKLIKKEKVYGDASYKVPPKNKIYVEINENVLNRIRTILENGS